MRFDILSRGTIKESVIIILLALLIGLLANALNPNGVVLSRTRPKMKVAPDSIYGIELPHVSIGSDTIIGKVISGEPQNITIEQLLGLLKKDKAILLDARDGSEFEKEHIPHAMNLPITAISDFGDTLRSLPRDTWLVCYCDGPLCDKAELLAEELINSGFKFIAIYTDGLSGWKKSGQLLTN